MTFIDRSSDTQAPIGTSIPLAVIKAKADLLVGAANSAADRLPVGAVGSFLAVTAANTLGWSAGGTHPDLAAHDALGLATQQELNDHTHPIQRTTVTTAAYTAVLGDANKVIRMTFVGPSTLTIPANATVPFPLDTIINPYAAGGALTIAAATGVTIDNNASGVAQGVEVSLRYDGADKWVRAG